MDVKILYFDDCANWQTADARLKEALQSLGVDSDIDYELVESFERAEELGFRGSPTILLDGEDPFAHRDAPIGFACRVYVTSDGREGSPTTAQLRDAIQAQLRMSG